MVLKEFVAVESRGSGRQKLRHWIRVKRRESVLFFVGLLFFYLSPLGE